MADWFNQTWRYWVHCPGEPLRRFITWAGAQRLIENDPRLRVNCASGSRNELEAGHVTLADLDPSRSGAKDSSRNVAPS